MINGMNHRGIAIWFKASARDFPLFQSVQICYGDHPANQPTNSLATRGYFPTSKTTETWN